MKHFVVVFALWLLPLFWGAGLAWLATPRRWRRHWPLFVPICGLALQSATVWYGTRLGLAGTDRYAWWSLTVPGALLAFSLFGAGRRWFGDLWRHWPVWLLSLLCLGLLTIPLARSSRGLTTISLGSCDAADYAAGARVLKEFAQSDRSGFLGHTEVVRLHSVDNFYDHWMRLNHFSPSALIALDGTLLDCRPEHIISLFTISLVALTLPLVYWLSRSAMRLGQKSSLGLAAFFGISPLAWYAVFHVAPGQVLAAQAIALITWTGIMLWREQMPKWQTHLSYGLLLFLGFGMILGSYNFIVIVCLVPASAYVLLRLLGRHENARLLPWAAAVLSPLALSVLFYAERARGLWERFLLFRQFDFGWKIPALSPEAWLGAVAAVDLSAYPKLPRIVLSTLVVLLFFAGLVYEFRRRSDRALVALALAVPALAGYLFLVVRGALLGTNASYDAYKLLSVFLPGILPALAIALVPGLRGGWKRNGLVGCILLFTGLNLSVAYQFQERMSNPPLRVDTPLMDIRAVDAMPQVASVNMRVPDFWDRLWANAFLLRKRQFFETYTYEGRRNTALKGQWDLEGNLVRVLSPKPSEYVLLNNFFSLHDTRSIYYARVSGGEGWYEREKHFITRWRWTKGDATLTIQNPQNRPLRLKGSFDTLSIVKRELEILINGKQVCTLKVGTKRQPYEIPVFEIPPGSSTLQLRSPTPPVQAGPNDKRLLGVCLYSLEFQVQP